MIIRIMWKNLFVLISTINQISYGSCFPIRQISSSITESENCINREVLEKEHYVDYLENEDKSKRSTTKYRKPILVLSGEEIKIKRIEFEKKHYEYCFINPEVCKLWPEVQEIPEFHCKRFCKRILPLSQDSSLITARPQRVILHYIERQNKNNGTLDPVDVNAIACRLHKPMLSRSYVYFIRAPSYPYCVFYIIREMLSNAHFYIVEEICDSHNQQISIFQIFLENGKFRSWKGVPKKRKKSFPVHEEVFSEKFNLEQRHYEAYKLDKETLTTWPEAQSTLNHICTHFLQGIIKNKEDLSLVIGNTVKVVLHYTEIQYTTNNQRIKPLILTAIQCRLSKLMNGCRFVHLLRSPSHPNCTFLLTRICNSQDKYRISDEICESTNFIARHRIVSQVRRNAVNKKRRIGGDTIERRQIYEHLHLHYYLEQQNDCEKWPELELINKEDICHGFLTQIYPRVTQKCNVEVGSKSLQLKYCVEKNDLEEAFPPMNVKALICTLPFIRPPNRFHFIRTSKPNCVYWAKRFNENRQYYFITKELCVNEPLFTNQIEVDLSMDDLNLLNELMPTNKGLELSLDHSQVIDLQESMYNWLWQW